MIHPIFLWCSLVLAYFLWSFVTWRKRRSKKANLVWRQFYCDVNLAWRQFSVTSILAWRQFWTSPCFALQHREEIRIRIKWRGNDFFFGACRLQKLSVSASSNYKIVSASNCLQIQANGATRKYGVSRLEITNVFAGVFPFIA